MRKVLLILGMLLLFAVRASAQPPETPLHDVADDYHLDLSTPEHAVYSYLLMWSQGELQAAAACVEGAEKDGGLTPLIKKLKSEPFSVPDGYPAPKVEIEGDNATVEVTLYFKVNLMSRVTHVEKLPLHRTANKWRIVPQDAASVAKWGSVYTGPPAMLKMASCLAHPRTALLALQSYESLSNIKEIGMGIFAWAEDYDDKFTLDNANVIEKVKPYLRSEKIFYVPDENIAYSLNENLKGSLFSKIPNRATTVLLYDGKNGELNYRYDGKAAVGFADGHVKFVKPEEAKQLVWKPGA